MKEWVSKIVSDGLNYIGKKFDGVATALSELKPVNRLDVNLENPPVFPKEIIVKLDGIETIVGKQGIPGEPGRTPTTEELITLIEPLIPVVRDGRDGRDADEEAIIKAVLKKIPEPKDGHTASEEELVDLIKPLIPVVRDGKDGKDGSPDTGKEIIKKINKDENKKLKIKKEKVEGFAELEEYIRTVDTNGRNVARFVGQTTRVYNLSSLLNGVTKTFTIPQNTLILSIHFSSSPFVANPATDFTRTATSVTFTSEINAASTLATGQTVIIVYANP